MKDCYWLVALVPIAALWAGTADAACAPGTFVGHQNGEDYCSSTSDSSGYRPSSVNVTVAGKGARGPHTKSQAAVELVKRRKHRWY